MTKTVLDRELHLTPEAEKTQIRLPFAVETDARAMSIDLLYTPKTLDDREKALRLAAQTVDRDAPDGREQADGLSRFLPLKNLITISLDDANGYRGAAHRQPSEQHLTLSATTAAPGLYPGKIGAGDWTLTLSVHALVTDGCTCTVTVRIQEREEER